MFFEDSADNKRAADLKNLEVSLDEVRQNLRDAGDFRLRLLIDMLSIEIKRETTETTRSDRPNE